MTTTMNMTMPIPMLAPDYSHLSLYTPVEVDGFTFQDPQDALDFDFDDDEIVAKDIDDFTSLLASVDDEETARDIDDFATLMTALSKGQEKEAELNDVSLVDLLAEPVTAKKVSFADDVDMEDSSEYDSDDDEDDDLVVAAPQNASPFMFLAPIDPRCCIQTPIFKTLDSRIPMINIPKMDVGFGRLLPSSPLKVLSTQVSVQAAVSTACPSSPGQSVVSDEGDAAVNYVHDPERCWVCKSGKSEERKRVLHRYVEKRYRRNWKRGARYKARSRVASSRVREGGRFVTKCEWVAVGYD
ncbi:Aste57867_22307 [Aphanomyces stellatus]|uniref:Aste57867_16782 protein n=1 Tax=Aphanomyces stellatus TaxID=120398 RepID=A0A485LPP1_9STRA|nr:hypothetical protein As57867_022237 [Aphanomyces stellatus]KAF0692091.1 hypothetical protein As57867_016725 [Aphanomyces stellatus]KAF0709204.1 hypothetical protein As57867_006035 [Aphanomyces stellatus]VFT83062.1 Aste57867_6049 [Aphanomyces stellatus]VFT93547.1 Aste57867_16782 [Aphanomyces stellatus]